MNSKRKKTNKLKPAGKRLIGLWGLWLVLLCSPWVGLHAQTTYSYFRTEVGVPYFPQLSNAPSLAEAGMIYFNTTDKKFYWYDGTQWICIGCSGSSSVPTAGAVAVSGTIYIGNSLTGTYTYTDPLGTLEGSGTTASSYQWYSATDASGTGKTAISGATATSYTIASPVASGKYLAFSVKPRSLLGITGAETLSGWNLVYSGGITASVSLTSNPVLYQTQVVSPTVGYTYAGSVTSGTCAESGATYKWYRNSSASSSGATTISSGSGTPSSYTVLSSDVGQYIGLGVTPNSTCNASAPEVISWKQVSTLTPMYATATISGLTSSKAQNNTTITAVKGTYSVTPAITGTEGTPTYQWYYATDASGTGKTAMTGQTASTHAVNIAGGYGYNSTSFYLAVGITPKTVSGETGSEVLSGWAQVQTYAVMADGVLVVPIVGPSGQIWMDRNLGASQAATSATDYLAFGSLFQWSRPADGHQLITWTSSTTGTGVNGTTTTLSTGLVPANSSFIIGPTVWFTGYEPCGMVCAWYNGSVQTATGPCPAGYHVPTSAQCATENAAIAALGSDYGNIAFATLKMTTPYMRHFVNGVVGYGDSTSPGYWTTYNAANCSEAGRWIPSQNAVGLGRYAYGCSIRCIKD